MSCRASTRARGSGSRAEGGPGAARITVEADEACSETRIVAWQNAIQMGSQSLVRRWLARGGTSETSSPFISVAMVIGLEAGWGMLGRVGGAFWVTCMAGTERPTVAWNVPGAWRMPGAIVAIGERRA